MNICVLSSTDELQNNKYDAYLCFSHYAALKYAILQSFGESETGILNKFMIE